MVGKHGQVAIYRGQSELDENDALIQVMPGARLRVNPAAVPDIAIIVMTLALRYESVMKRTFRGLDDTERAQLHGMKEHARHALSALMQLQMDIMNSFPTENYNRSVHAWNEACENMGIDSPVELIDQAQREQEHDRG